MKKNLIVVLSIILVIAFASTSLGLSTVPVKEIKTVSKLILKIGQSITLKATITPADASDKKMTFSSGNKLIAAVDKNGKITAKKEGKTVITATSTSNKKISAKCNVTVSKTIKESKVVIYFPGDKKPLTDEVWAEVGKRTKSQLNSSFTANFIPFGDYLDKMMVLYSSGDKFDMNFDASWLTYSKLVNKGAFLPLNEMLPQYAPKLLQSYKNFGMIDAASAKGKIYALPWLIKSGSTPYFIWREDLAKKAGLKVTNKSITTIEELDKFLTDAKKALPDMKIFGWDQYQIPNPLVFLLQKYNLGQFIGFSLVFDLSDPKCKLLPIEQTQAFKEAAIYIKKWYDEGIISKNLMVDSGSHAADAVNGKAFSWQQGFEGAFNINMADPSYVKGYSVLYPKNMSMNIPAHGNIMVINKNAANPDKALMLLELIESDQSIYDLVMYGILNKTYVLNGKVADYPAGMDAASSNYMDWFGQWGMWNLKLMRPTKANPEGFWQKQADIAMSPGNIDAKVSNLFPDTESVKNEIAKRDANYSEFGKLLMYGVVKDVDKSLAEYIEKQKAAGIDKILAELQKQVDDYLKNN